MSWFGFGKQEVQSVPHPELVPLTDEECASDVDVSRIKLTRLAERAKQTSGNNLQIDQTPLQAPIPLDLRVTLIEKSLLEVQRREGACDLPKSCSIERHNQRVYSVQLSRWIVFLDTKSGEPAVYHSLPLSVWNA